MDKYSVIVCNTSNMFPLILLVFVVKGELDNILFYLLTALSVDWKIMNCDIENCVNSQISVSDPREVSVRPILTREIRLPKLKELLSTDNGRKLLEEEFSRISVGKRYNWTVGERPENMDKNRYDDLLAYDHTRVKLKPSTALDFVSEFNDYINANYIDGYNYDKEYVATQGPLANTEVDFWRMIWQLNATKIVMLANLIEHDKPKVHKYWPDSKGTYGEFNITRIAQHDMDDIKHVLRIFKIKKAGVSKKRFIRQFHFTGWPDLGVPDDRMSVVSLLNQVRSYNPHSTAPIVVHCSAGVGRTGTVILTDSMIQRAKAEGVVDFAKRLDSMRDQRVDVVEKKEQYIFAHQAINSLFNDPSSQAYLDAVARQYEDWGYEDFVKEHGTPPEVPLLIKKMDWHVRKMRQLVNAFQNEFRRDAELPDPSDVESTVFH